MDELARNKEFYIFIWGAVGRREGETSRSGLLLPLGFLLHKVEDLRGNVNSIRNFFFAWKSAV